MPDPKTDVAVHQGGRAVAAQTDPSAMAITPAQRLEMVREALLNPAVDPDKARAMFQLMREMENDERQAQFNRDKIAAKAAMPAIYKRGFNSHQKTSYVKFEDMQRAIDPILDAHNLMLDFDLATVGKDIAVTPILRHRNGWIEKGGTLTGPPDTGPGRTPIQSVGSSGSYLKRYATEAILNLVRDGEDNDGAGVGREDYRLNDRQEGLLVDAQAAFDRGQYEGYYQTLKAKDRAFLISSGHHARLGGVAALPDARRAETVDQGADALAEQRRDDAPADQDQRAADAPATKPKQTAEEWTAEYERKCEAAASVEALMEIQSDGPNTRALAKLQTTETELHRRAVQAGQEAYARLSTPAEGDGDAPATGEDLFGGDGK